MPGSHFPRLDFVLDNGRFPVITAGKQQRYALMCYGRMTIGLMLRTCRVSALDTVTEIRAYGSDCAWNAIRRKEKIKRRRLWISLKRTAYRSENISGRQPTTTTVYACQRRTTESRPKFSRQQRSSNRTIRLRWPYLVTRSVSNIYIYIFVQSRR